VVEEVCSVEEEDDEVVVVLVVEGVTEEEEEDDEADEEGKEDEEAEDDEEEEEDDATEDEELTLTPIFEQISWNAVNAVAEVPFGQVDSRHDCKLEASEEHTQLISFN
jgi:hypothetical protein